MEGLLTLLVLFLLSTAANWIAKRRQEQEEAESRADPDRQAPYEVEHDYEHEQREPAPHDWQAELRKLLDQDRERHPEPHHAPPPRLSDEAPPQEPQPQAQPQAELVSKAEPVSPVVVAERAREHFREAQRKLAERVKKNAPDLSRQKEATEKQVQHLRDKIAERSTTLASTQRAGQSAFPSTGASQRSKPPHPLVHQLRSPAVARRAMVASIILAPPKAFEDS